MFDLRVLGPVEFRVHGALCELRSAAERGMIALLVFELGRPVTVDRIRRVVWPAKDVSRRTLTMTAYGVRRALGPSMSSLQNECYRLEVPAEASDLGRFRLHLAAARTAAASGDHAVEIMELEASLHEWSGSAMQGLDGIGFSTVRRALDNERLNAARALLNALATAEMHAQVITNLTTYLQIWPHEEVLVLRLAEALGRTGRRAEIPDVLAAYRERLAQDQDMVPSTSLVQACERLARHAEPVEAIASGLGSPLIPHQLPPSPAGFVGREPELRKLTAHVGDGRSTVVITGTPGVGKSALALQWAHRSQFLFRDGVLYAQLDGYAGESPRTADQVLHEFLRALNVSVDAIGASTNAMSGQLRSLLADRRMLLVLDDAHDVAQVRPLLPGAGDCVAVITTRGMLNGLVASEGARTLSLERLTEEQSLDLLAEQIGAPQVAAESASARELATLCAGLPLALRIAACLVVEPPGQTLARLVSELRVEQSRLDALDLDEQDLNVRTVFASSYRRLGVGASTLFRLLALHPGPDMDLTAVAALIGGTDREANRLVAQLLRAHLVEQRDGQRISMHDLLKVFAAEHLDPDEPAAVRRMLDFYLHRAIAADLRLDPARKPVVPMSSANPFVNEKAATAWLAAEAAVLPGLVDKAGSTGNWSHGWQLSWALVTFLWHRNQSETCGRILLSGLKSARLGRDVTGEAAMSRLLANNHLRSGRLEEAADFANRAAALSRELGDTQSVGHCDYLLATIERHDDQALRYYQSALTAFEAAADDDGQALAHNGIGWIWGQLGHPTAGLDHCRRSVELHRAARDRNGEAAALDSIGFLLSKLGDHVASHQHYAQAIQIYRELGYRSREAGTLADLGDAHQAAGRMVDARSTWFAAAEIYDELREPGRAAPLRKRINSA